jgi:hypothetical protein
MKNTRNGEPTMKIEVTIDHLRQYSIFVGLPMFNGICQGITTKSTNELAAMCARYGIALKFYYLLNESLITRARNYCVDEFLRSECTHLLFLDSDIGFDPRDVLSLLGIQTSYPDQYDVIAAPYPKKSIAWEKVKKAVELGKAENPFDLIHYTADYVFNPLSDTESFRVDLPVEVLEAGTGFMLIPRHVFERYMAAYPELRYKPDHTRTENFDGSREITAYFDCGIDQETKRYLSEDYLFCRNARKIGIKIHMCPWMNLQHVGSYIYRGSMIALAGLDVSPTSSKESNPKHYKKKTGIRY